MLPTSFSRLQRSYLLYHADITNFRENEKLPYHLIPSLTVRDLPHS